MEISTENYASEDTQHGRYLTFNLGHESFGLEISYVKEIVGMQPITKLPGAPDYAKGIINLRGRIIPVVDARMRFGMEAGEYTERTCIIVVDLRETPVGLIVDNVAEVMAIDDDNIVPTPSAGTGANHSAVKAIGKVGGDVKLLLECDHLVGAIEQIKLAN